MSSTASPARAWRGPATGRPPDVLLPPARMPLWRAGRMLKRWRYLGVYGPELMLCVGEARIGPVRQAWWAVWDRERRWLHERTHALNFGRPVSLSADRAAVRHGDVEIELAIEGEAVETVTDDGGGYAWTAKHGAARARGSVVVGARRWPVDSPAFVDVSAGYHPRHTSWRWSAGNGHCADGRAVAWNLVEGIHDSARDSERTVWVNGEPREVGPVRFDEDLGGIAFDDGSRLGFAPEASRRRDDNLVLVRSRYEQPFGTFHGTLPGGLRLAEGFGVMERHDALW